ncbi:MAG: DNA cytosine methyltransferase [Pseudomonadota bacterium]
MSGPIRTLSLFSGAGGLDIGFHKAGFDILASVEIESKYAKTLSANAGEGRFFGPNLKVHCEDVTKFDSRAYSGQEIDCIIGGPPCQTFSAAGRRSGGVIGTADARGQLFSRFCEIIAFLQPKVFVFENVYGLPGANGGGPWKEILRAFSELGYEIRWEVVDAADYGVPQHRERLILVGSRIGAFEFPEPTHGPDSKSGKPLTSVREAIADLQDASEPHHDSLGGLYGHLLPLVPAGLNYAFFTAEMGHPEPVFAWRSKFHDLLYKVDPGTPCRTIKAQPGKFTGPFHWKNRHFTTAELKRLQTFPDEYHIEGSPNVIVEQIGNSVPPRLGYVIARSIREQLFDRKNELEFPVRELEFRSNFRQRQRERTDHFKTVAAKAIRDLQASGELPISITPFDERYALKRTNFFEFEKTAASKNPDYLALVKDKGDHLEACFQVPGSAARGELRLTGLRKYLGRIDTVSMSLSLSSADDIFPAWKFLEQCLVTRSRFFSLIDIYGHYANRGDLVCIETDLGLDKSEPMVRALNFIGNSKNCGGFFSRRALCAEWEVSAAELDVLVEKLRELRIDIRTDRSHPIIGPDRVLCTYPFPLLSPRALVESKVEFLSSKAAFA